MKSKTFIYLGTALVLALVVFFGCKEEKEDDLIEGKWIENFILMDSTKTACQKNCYLLFAPYSINLEDRTVQRYQGCTTYDHFINPDNGEPDSTEILPHYEPVGKYTITGDTLIILDRNHITNTFVISWIDSKDMRIKSLDYTSIIPGTLYKRLKD
jgi:hypothetical protein